MSIYLLAFVIGIVAGLRALTAPAALSWAAQFGWLHLENTWLAFLGYTFTPYIFSILAVVEYVTDTLPNTPSRKVPMQFGARLVSGAFCGAAIGLSSNNLVECVIAGIIGSIVGTYGGAELRGRLARAVGRDLPIALLEDAVAIVMAALVVMGLR